MTIDHIHVQRTEFVCAIRAIGGGHGVGDKGGTMRRETERKLHHGILHVETIVDQLDGHAWILHCGRDRARLTMVQAVHRVEHVRHDASSCIKTGLGGLVVGITMPHRRRHAGGAELADGGNAMRQFRGNGYLPDAAQLAVDST